MSVAFVRCWESYIPIEPSSPRPAAPPGIFRHYAAHTEPRVAAAPGRDMAPFCLPADLGLSVQVHVAHTLHTGDAYSTQPPLPVPQRIFQNACGALGPHRISCYFLVKGFLKQPGSAGSNVTPMGHPALFTSAGGPVTNTWPGMQQCTGNLHRFEEHQFCPQVHQVPPVGICQGREIALRAPLPSILTSGIEFQV